MNPRSGILNESKEKVRSALSRATRKAKRNVATASDTLAESKDKVRSALSRAARKVQT